MKKLLIPFLFLIGCNITDNGLEPLQLDLVLDGRLPLDERGFYHLTLNPYTNQTTHRITGKVLHQERQTKVDWESNLNWFFNGELVPTVNSTSYSTELGEINVMIAPIYDMKGDTLIVTGYVTESNESETISIVLK